jgi:hypothetical protein
MFRKLLFPTSIRMLALLVGCASLPACWWDGHSGTSPTTYTVGGGISGLTGSGLVLANGTDQLTVTAGASSFTFPTAVAAQSTYAVTIVTQPSGASCVVTNGSGTASAAVTTVQVTCAAAQFHLGGTLSGLTASGLMLANGTDSVSPAANATTFTFPTTVASGATYNVTVSAQPTGLTCTVAAGAGTMAGADITSVAITCTPAHYHVGGTITGLSAAGLVLANGSDTVSPAANASAFTMPATVASGTAYAVTVQTQPTGLTCSVTGGSGTVGTADVASIAVSCSNGTGFTALAGQTSCPAGVPDQNGTGSAASLALPSSIVADNAGNVYTVTYYFGIVNKITPAGVVTTLAGQYGTSGYTDGAGTAAQFDATPILGGIDGAGNLYISESSNIRRVTPAGVVSTFAGPTTGEQGYLDATGSAARFEQWGLAVAPDGTLYVADYGNEVIRKVTAAGVATTLAGQHGQYGYADGVGTAAQFRAPMYAVIDANGTTYVGDQGGMMIRKVTADGTVTTLAGTTSNGWADGQGANAMFYGIQGIAIGPAGSIYVLDQPSATNGSVPHGANWGAIRQISADGTVKTVVVSTAADLAYFGVPPGNHLTISQPLTAIGSAPNGTLFAASQCAVGKIVLP